jgi:hypothetical protein
MQSNIFTLAPGGRPVAATLGFQPKAVLVTNYTSSYVRIPDAPPDIPPFVYGAVIALPQGVRNANASLVSALPAPVGPAVPRTEATLTWLDAEMTPAPGTLLPGTLAAVGQLLHTTAPGFGSAGSGSFSLPTGTESLSVITIPGGGSGNGSFTLVGATTGFTYFSGVKQIGVSYEVVPVDSVSDPILNWSWISNAANGAADWFVSPLPTAAPVDGAILALPWQAPRTDAGIIDSTGATPATLVAGVTGQRIWVWSWKLEIGTTAAARFAGLRASSRPAFDGTFAALWSGPTGLNTDNGNAGGLRLPLGDGLLLDTTSAAGETVRAAVGFTQA